MLKETAFSDHSWVPGPVRASREETRGSPDGTAQNLRDKLADNYTSSGNFTQEPSI